MLETLHAPGIDPLQTLRNQALVCRAIQGLTREYSARLSALTFLRYSDFLDPATGRIVDLSGDVQAELSRQIRGVALRIARLKGSLNLEELSPDEDQDFLFLEA